MAADSKGMSNWVLPFESVGLESIPVVGGKNASLGEMIRSLGPCGICVPAGFATTAAAYRHHLQTATLRPRLHQLLDGLDVADLPQLQRAGLAARELLLSAPLPRDLEQSIAEAYQRLGSPAVAVRSSATAEDLPDASFAGQQETYLNVRGEADLLEACRQCYASLFTDRAISYRQLNGFDHFSVALSIGVQRMVRSDLACSGVMFSLDTESGFREAVLLTAAYGLGENVVQGAVNPDEYLIFKPTLQQGFAPIVSKRRGAKAIRMVYGERGTPCNEPVPEDERQRFALDDAEALQLARWACQIEDHYSQKRGQSTPMDIEWAKDGTTGELVILQARPETVQSRRTANVLRTWSLQPHQAPLLCRGRAIGTSVSQGPARILRHPSEINRFQNGDVLVTERTDPDWEPILKRASGVVTNPVSYTHLRAHET